MKVGREMGRQGGRGSKWGHGAGAGMGDGRRGVVRKKPELSMYKKAVRTPVHTYMNMYTQASYMHRYTDVSAEEEA